MLKGCRFGLSFSVKKKKITVWKETLFSFIIKIIGRDFVSTHQRLGDFPPVAFFQTWIRRPHRETWAWLLPKVGKVTAATTQFRCNLVISATSRLGGICTNKGRTVLKFMSYSKALSMKWCVPSHLDSRKSIRNHLSFHPLHKRWLLRVLCMANERI